MAGNNTFVANDVSIRLGQWTDWTHGRLYGATITLSRHNGNLLQSFAATFTAFACTQLWRIASYFVYHARSNNMPRDGLTHQRQAIFRNAGSVGAALTFLQQAWSWHKKADKAALRSSSWVFVALGFAAAAGIASTFTAFITEKATSNRLITSSNCGYWQRNPNDNPSSLNSINDTWTAARYARECYVTNPESVLCKQYSSPNLKYTASHTVACPFAENVCDPGDQRILNMTTDLLDSLIDFGINSPPPDRLYFQKNMICSPIPRNKYWVPPERNDTTRTWFAMFGPIRNSTDDIETNYTYAWNTFARRALIGYIVTPLAANIGEYNRWVPAPAFARTDADLSMVFISSNAIRYKHRNNDPIFGTNRIDDDGLTFPVRAIGCAAQYRAYNPINALYSPWMGQHQLTTASQTGVFWPHHGLSPYQMAILARIVRVFTFSNIGASLLVRGPAALRVQESVYGLQQLADIPDDQWRMEVLSWFEAALAKLQI